MKHETIEKLAEVYADEIAGEIYEGLTDRFEDIIRTVLNLAKAGKAADEIVEEAVRQYDAAQESDEDEENPEVDEKIEELRKVREALNEKKRSEGETDDEVDTANIIIGGSGDLTEEDATEIAKFIEGLLKKKQNTKIKVVAE